MATPETTEKQLEILHDHYKETFSRQREMERGRDRLMLWVILLFALLALEIGYPAEFGGSLKSLTIAGTDVDLSKLPLAALLTVSWVLNLFLSLRYCQTSIFVDRQYHYVHQLEDVISPLVGGGDTYRRESDVYIRGYPMLLNVAWFAYVVIFPAIAVLGTIGLICWEWSRLSYPILHRVFDTLIALALISFFLLYRVEPYVRSRWFSPKLRTPIKTG